MRTHPYHNEWKEQQASEATRRLLLQRAAPAMRDALIAARDALLSRDDQIRDAALSRVKEAIWMAEGQV